MKSKKHGCKKVMKWILAASVVLMTALVGAKHTKAAEAVLYVEASNVQELYRQKSNYAYPDAPEGDYIFAGWFADANGETPLYDGFEEDTAYAKYVPQNVLGVKAQITCNAAFDTDETVNMRFITSVDCLDYEVVGFDFVIFHENNVVTDKESVNVYKALAGIDGDGKVINYKPNQVFHSTSKWFMAFTFTNISNKHFGHGIIAKPYWVTYDGTKVYGVEATKTVNMAYTPYTTDVNLVNMTTGGMTLPTGTSAVGNAYNLSTQGGCTDGTYWYQAYRDHNSSYVDGEGFSEDTNYDDDTALIYKYRLSDDGSSWDITVLNKTVELPLHHANDITYNDKLGVLVIAHGLGNRAAISFLDPDDLTIVDPADLGFEESCDSYEIISETYDGTEYPYLNLLYNGEANEIWSIEYNRLSDRYAVGISTEQAMYVLDADFAVVGSKIKSSGKTINFTTQSIAADDTYIYSILSNSPSNGDATSGDLANFDGHVIAIYTWDGSFVANINVDVDDMSKAVEPESISIYNNVFYIGSYYSSKCYVYKISATALDSEYAALVTKEDGTEEYYFTLEAALMNADEGSMVTLLKDVTVTSQTTIINDNVTLTNAEGNDFTITRGLASALVVNESEGLTIKGNSTGSLTIDGASKSGGSLIKNNEGAVMTLEDVIVHSVTGTSTDTINGGVVYNYGDLTVTGCTFTDNQSTGRAAVLYLDSGSVSDISGCVFTNNQSSAGSGGAIYVAGEAEITDSAFTGNYTTGNGGAINCVGGVMIVDSCDFKENYSSGENGGAVGITGESTAVFEGVGTFTGNYATAKNGGGAIYTNASKLSVDGYTFTENQAVAGGAIYVNTTVMTDEATAEDAAILVENSTFASNTATSKSAGAIYVAGLRMDVLDCVFSGNTAASVGGAMNITSSAEVLVDAGSFEGNSAKKSTTEGGGAVSITGASTVVFDGNGTFTNNNADFATAGGGGAIYTNNSTVTVKGSYAFSGNSAAKGYGGAIYSNYSGEQLNLRGASFEGNTATSSENGHAIYNLRTLNLSDTSFTEGNGDVIIATTTVDSSVRYGRVFIAGEITGANLVYKRGYAENTDRLSVSVGAGGLDHTSTVTLQIMDDDYVVGETVFGKTGRATAQQLINATEIVKVCQTEDNPTTEAYWYVGEDGTLCQGLASEWLTVGTSEGCDYDSLAGAISSVDSGSTLCIMTDLTEAETITVDKEITIVSDPSLEEGVIIKRTDDVSDASTFITVSSEGDLMLRGHVAIDGDKENRTGSASFVKNQGTFTLGAMASIQNVTSTVNGAALFNSGTATIYGTFAYNEATEKFGGAVRTEGNSNKLITEGALFVGNTAKEAGAVSATNSSGTLTFTKTTFRENSTTGAGGGAIRANLIPTALYGCVFENNTAYGKGGAVYATCNLTIQDYIVSNYLVRETLFDSNTSTTEIAGALHFTTSSDTVYTLSMTGGTFLGNTAAAKSGGAVHILNCIGDFEGVTFEENQTTVNGGAVYYEGSDSATVTFTDCVFDKNEALYFGGGIYMKTGVTKLLSTTSTTSDSAFVGNQTTLEGTSATAAGCGGAVFAAGGTLYVGDDTNYGYSFEENSAYYNGGAMYLASSAVGVVTKSEFTGNSVNADAGNNGGAINSNSEDLTVSETLFKKNTARKAGAAIMAYASDSTVITDCEFVKNGTIYSGDAQSGTVTGENSVVTVEGSIFRKNDTNSSRGGAAIYVNGGTVTIKNTSFVKNLLSHASAKGGAAIYAHSANAATITLSGTIYFKDDTQDVYLAGSINTLSRDEIDYIPGIDE